MTSTEIKIVFMGSPDFAVPTLEALAKYFNVIGVVTQPDKPKGRSRTPVPPPVKIAASELQIPLIQPRRVRESEPMDTLRSWNPDVIVVAAFGQILRPELLELPPYGCINVHGSLLPRWRGAAPIQHAILNGDPITGITIMRMDAGIDTGEILSQAEMDIPSEATTETLSQSMAVLGANLLVKTLPAYVKGSIKCHQQDDEGATYASMIKKADGLLDLSQSSYSLERQIRAYHPWPGTYTFFYDKILKVYSSKVINIPSPGEGNRFIHESFPAIGTQDGALQLTEVQLAGKKRIAGKDFLRGAQDWEILTG